MGVGGDVESIAGGGNNDGSADTEGGSSEADEDAGGGDKGGEWVGVECSRNSSKTSFTIF